MIDAFQRTGYMCRPLLSAPQVQQLREICDTAYHETGDREMLVSRFLANPSLSALPFSEPVIDTLTLLLGFGCHLFPNFTVRSGLYADWHIDAGFKNADARDPQTTFVQCAVYLQDNDLKSGGGLDVVPGSHVLPPVTDGTTLTQRLLEQVQARHSIGNKAGDLVVWDARLLHRGTPATDAPVRLKFGIHWTVACASAAIDDFMRHLIRRSTVMRDGEVRIVPRYAEMANVQYPANYPASVVREVERWGLAVESARPA
ncbi:MAG TPA: phytanoyl-CoA dioxygenase family protein [Vicinamibacterales bacterium]|nr:phytanoyl-CoA dioxygenase family protein [Vicinamibacterales bacterium]